MRTILTVVLTLIVLSFGGISAPAQTCGNVNGYGVVDLSDLAFLMSNLGYGYPVPPDPAMADCDGRVGITVSDAATLMNYLFGFGANFNCSPGLNYSLTSAPGDTLIFPTMLGVPNGIDSVALPVFTNFGDGAYAVYIPFLPAGPTGNGVFHLGSVTINDEGGFSDRFTAGDTTILIVLFRPHDPTPVGRHVTFTLNYIRSTPGVGNIVPTLVNRSPLLIPSFERNYDLFQPQNMYQMYTLPPETLTTTPAQLVYTAMAGKVARDSFLVSFGSTGIPISFNLASSDPWIILKDLPGTPLTTPASIWVKASAAALGVGTYNGTINIAPVNPGTPMKVSTVAVAFDVTKPILYPPGDFNCDGIANLVDLSQFISYLSGGGGVLTDCNK